MGYLWSSYAVNSGMRAEPLVSPHPEYVALSADGESRHAAYRGLFDEQFDAALLATIRDAINGGYPLASDTFKTAVLTPLGSRTERGKPGPRAHHPRRPTAQSLS